PQEAAQFDRRAGKINRDDLQHRAEGASAVRIAREPRRPLSRVHDLAIEPNGVRRIAHPTDRVIATLLVLKTEARLDARPLRQLCARVRLRQKQRYANNPDRDEKPPHHLDNSRWRSREPSALTAGASTIFFQLTPLPSHPKRG